MGGFLSELGQFHLLPRFGPYTGGELFVADQAHLNWVWRVRNTFCAVLSFPLIFGCALWLIIDPWRTRRVSHGLVQMQRTEMGLCNTNRSCQGKCAHIKNQSQADCLWIYESLLTSQSDWHLFQPLLGYPKYRPKRNLDPKAWFILNLLSSHLLPNQRFFGELFGISSVLPSTFLKRIAMYCCLTSQPKFTKYFTNVCVWVNICFAFIGF